jgi:hypothetical protein
MEDKATQTETIPREDSCPLEDSQMPIYPSAILEPRADDPPAYPYDMDDIEERKTYKLWNIWITWSHLLKNGVVDKLECNPDDNEQVKELKWMVVSLLDRIGKILALTNLIQEMKKQGVDENKEE